MSCLLSVVSAMDTCVLAVLGPEIELLVLLETGFSLQGPKGSKGAHGFEVSPQFITACAHLCLSVWFPLYEYDVSTSFVSYLCTWVCIIDIYLHLIFSTFFPLMHSLD